MFVSSSAVACSRCAYDLATKRLRQEQRVADSHEGVTVHLMPAAGCASTTIDR